MITRTHRVASLVPWAMLVIVLALVGILALTETAGGSKDGRRTRQESPEELFGDFLSSLALECGPRGLEGLVADVAASE